MATPAPANDYTTPGQDLLLALQAECEEARQGHPGRYEYGEAVLGAIVARVSWRDVHADVRAVFERAALRFLSEDGEEE